MIHVWKRAVTESLNKDFSGSSELRENGVKMEFLLITRELTTANCGLFLVSVPPCILEVVYSLDHSYLKIF